jgi:hypothetical protein
MALLADIILIVHFLFVLFVAGGLILTWVGAAMAWRWVRDFWFRLGHLAAIVFVAAESLIGIACPLTQWENTLRQARPYDGGFIQSWLRRLLYYDLPESTFTLVYILFALAVIITFLTIRPRPPGKKIP